MTRKAKIGLVFLGIAIIAPPTIWLVARPRVPIEFLDKKSPATFIFPGEFSGKPWIDWKAPGGTRVLYPTKRKLISGKVDPCVAGYLLYPESTGSRSTFYFGNDRLRIGGAEIPLKYAYLKDDSPSPTPSPSTSSFALPIGPYKTIRAVPFATEEAYREATLLSGSETYKVRLPVSHEFGPSKRRSEKFPIGSWHVKAVPRPWKVTTQDVTFDVTTDAPAGSMILLKLKWRNDVKLGPGWYSSNQDLIVEGKGKSGSFVVRRAQPSNRFLVDVVELAPVSVQLLAKRPKKGAQTTLKLNGKPIYVGGVPMGLAKQGFYVLDVRGRRLFDGKWTGLRTGQPYNFDDLNDGEIVDAIAYRAKKSQTTEGALDVPPPMSDTGQIVLSGTGGSFTIIRAGP